MNQLTQFLSRVDLLTHTIIRLAGIVTIAFVSDYVVDDMFEPTPGDANIGMGLVAFAIVAGAAGTWAFLDGTLLGWLRLPDDPRGSPADLGVVAGSVVHHLVRAARPRTAPVDRQSL